MLEKIVTTVRVQTTGWSAEAGDAVLYAGSALFAVVTARFSGLSLYRQWGVLAIGPYVVAAVASAVIGRRRAAHDTDRDTAAGARAGSRAARPGGSTWSAARVAVFVFVLIGATILPLSLEVVWRSEGNASAHVQPETSVVEQAAHRLARGEDPYRVIYRHHRVVVHVPDQPTYESFFPYLPLMTVFGLPSSTKEPIRLTDARIFFTIATLLVVGAALALARGPSEPKVRTLQFLTVLPSAALPLATGGDDMPVVAFLLLAMVLAQRRRPGWSGVAMGVAASMKFTAWPLAVFALFAARDASGRRRPGRMMLGMLAVAGPVVVPFIVQNPLAFAENVVLFPLGLSGVPSPAGSALPGHILVSIFPSLHTAVPVAAAIIGGALLLAYLVRTPPRTAADATRLAAWVMTAAIMLAPATRVGYLLYPVDFFVWSAMLRRSEAAESGSLPAGHLEELDAEGGGVVVLGGRSGGRG